MMSSSELRQIAERVGRFDAAGSERILAAADAIDDPGSHPGWAGADLRDAVAVESIVERLHDRHARPQLTSQLERVRNLLVLVPILITWLGLWYAASAYRAVTGADPVLAQQPFLLLWEQGFPGYDSPIPLVDRLTLSTVALIDVTVIGIILILTWVVHGQTSVAIAAATQRTRALESTLHKALWAGTLELRARGSISEAVDKFGRSSNRLLDELKAERTHLEDLVNGRERRMNEMKAFVTDFKSAAEDMSTVSHQLAVAVGVSVNSSRELAAAVTDLEARLRDATAAIDAASTQSAQAAGLLHSTAAASGAASSTLADAAGAFGPTAARMTQSIDVLRTEIAEFRTMLEASQAAQSAAVEAQTTAARSLDESVERLRQEAGILSRQRGPD